MTYSLERRGTLNHYIVNFQKELIKTISKSTTVDLKKEYVLDINDCGSRALGCGNVGSPDAVPHQMIFRLQFEIQESDLTCGLHGFSFSNWDKPHNTDGRSWGEIRFPLIRIPEIVPMPKTLANRVITVGISTGILRKENAKKDADNDLGKCCFVKAEEGSGEPFWMERASFDKKIALIVQEQKAVRLRGRDSDGSNGTRGALERGREDSTFVPITNPQSDQNRNTDQGEISDSKFDPTLHEDNSDSGGAIPKSNQRVSLLDGHSTGKEMPAGTEDLLRFEMETTHQHRPGQKQRPPMRDLGGTNLREIDSHDDGGYERPKNNERGREPRYKVMASPRELEANFARLNRDHPLKDPNFALNMGNYRPRVVEEQERTMLQQQPYRGHEEQNQDLNTTWDSSSDDKERHRYEEVASMRGPSTSQRNMIEVVRNTIGPAKDQHIRQHGDRRQDGHSEYQDLTPRYRANEESQGKNTYFHRQTKKPGGYENHVDFAGYETRRFERLRPRQQFSEQESRREKINLKMANILQIDTKLDKLGVSRSAYGPLNQDPAVEDDDYHMLYMVASTDPALLHKNYATRLAMMERLETRLEKVLKDKAEQFQKANEAVNLDLALEATRFSLRNLGISAHQYLDDLPATEYRRLRRY